MLRIVITETMSTDATSPGKPVSSAGSAGKPPSRAADKGKGRVEVDDEEDEDDDDEDEDMEDDDDDDGDEDDEFSEIDPTAIVNRRTRGVKVDYTSKEALTKAGLDKEEEELQEEEGEDSFAHDEAATH